MSKCIPEELRDHVLPFNWDVAKVWALKGERLDILVSDYEYLLHLPLWSSVPGRGMLYDLKPISVITDRSASPYQGERLKNVDTAYPLDFLMYAGKPWVLDGVHRLARLHLEDATTGKARFHQESSIPRIIVGERADALGAPSGRHRSLMFGDTEGWVEMDHDLFRSHASDGKREVARP